MDEYLGKAKGYKQNVSINAYHFCPTCSSLVPLKHELELPGDLVKMQIPGTWDSVEATAARHKDVVALCLGDKKMSPAMSN